MCVWSPRWRWSCSWPRSPGRRRSSTGGPDRCPTLWPPHAPPPGRTYSRPGSWEPATSHQIFTTTHSNTISLHFRFLASQQDASTAYFSVPEKYRVTTTTEALLRQSFQQSVKLLNNIQDWKTEPVTGGHISCFTCILIQRSIMRSCILSFHIHAVPRVGQQVSPFIKRFDSIHHFWHINLKVVELFGNLNFHPITNATQELTERQLIKNILSINWQSFIFLWFQLVYEGIPL